jgi:hypothetical protein
MLVSTNNTNYFLKTLKECNCDNIDNDSYNRLYNLHNKEVIDIIHNSIVNKKNITEIK